MIRTNTSKSAQVRAGLKHPVIDGDGHLIESQPVLWDYVRQVGGSDMVERYKAVQSRSAYSAGLSPQDKRDAWVPRGAWWALPMGATLDRATAHLPKLLHQRMDEFGIDYAILYPSLGMPVITLPGIADDEVRRVAARAVNTYLAETYREYSDRITPVAVIPAGTPAEAIEELEYAVKVLGHKVVMLQGYVVRPIPKVQREHPELFQYANRMDFLALDSDYDYDPLWAKFVELKVAVTCHSGTWGMGQRRSISSYVYNHIGNFGAASEGFCKAVFMGGVTRRFPTLNFAFLEGGVSWAGGLYADLIGHWEKRNAKAIEHLDPAKIDMDLMARLWQEYGDARAIEKTKEVLDMFDRERKAPRPAEVDEYARCKIQRKEEFKDLFARPFYFGCEADDPMNAWAFNSKINPFGAKLQAFFGSDIGHWDVPDMTETVEEAYEMVEKDLLSEGDFKDFMFGNVVQLHGGMNPDFFKGTVVEQEARKLLNEPRKG